jgi:serine/threonine protein kinase
MMLAEALRQLHDSAPEVLREQPPDARSDIFSFGAVLYGLLTGLRAFEGDNPDALRQRSITRRQRRRAAPRSIAWWQAAFEAPGESLRITGDEFRTGHLAPLCAHWNAVPRLSS